MSNAYKPHPFASLIPAMSDRDYRELKSDIERHGQREPIIVYNEWIIDGIHRYRACLELGRQPLITDLSLKVLSEETIREMVWSANVARRHLTDDQRVALAVAWIEPLEAKARERQERGVRADSPAGPDRHPTREAIAAKANVSTSKARQAMTVKKQRPDLVEPVQRGKMKLREAVKRVKEPEPKHDTRPEPKPGQIMTLLPSSYRARRVLSLQDFIDESAKQRITMTLTDEHGARVNLKRTSKSSDSWQLVW